MNVFLNNLLFSGFTFDEKDDELKFKYMFFNSLLIFNMFIVSIATIIRYFNEQYAQAVFDFFYVVLGFIVLLVARSSKKYFRNLVYFVIFYSFIIVGFIVYSDPNSYISFGWLYVLLLTTSFLLEKKDRIFIFIVFILLVLFVEVIQNSLNYIEIFLSTVPFLVTMVFLYFFDNQLEKMLLEREK